VPENPVGRKLTAQPISRPRRRESNPSALRRTNQSGRDRRSRGELHHQRDDQFDESAMGHALDHELSGPALYVCGYQRRLDPTVLSRANGAVMAFWTAVARPRLARRDMSRGKKRGHVRAIQRRRVFLPAALN